MEELLSTLLEQQEAWTVLQQIAAGGATCLLPSGRATPGKKDGNGRHVSHAGGWQPDLRYRALIEKLPCVTFMAALDDSVEELYISPQIEALLGFTQEEWLANPMLWYRQLHPDDKEAWVEAFARTCSTGAHFRVEYRMIARDGRIVWVQGQCQVIRDDEGRPLFLQGIAFDITHLKQAAKVEEARLAAEAANKAKSEFLARMSHEIRTPLNGVVGMIDLLRGTQLSDGQNRYAQLAREAADALLNVINDILDFSKIEAGKVEVEAMEFDLPRLLEDLTELLAPVARKKNLALTCLLRPDVPARVMGDPNRIRQVLTNLVNNALKFTPSGFVHICASLEEQTADASMIRIEVEDTGIGIPAERLDRLFKSFSQVDTSITRKFGGTGLGLAISKELVELMGGRIGISSKIGEGTTFWFTLKLAQSAGGSSPPTFGGLAEALATTRVLLVEPEPTYRRILAEQIEGRLSPESRAAAVDQAMPLMRQAVAENKPFAVAVIPPANAGAMEVGRAVLADPNLRHTKLIALLDVDDCTDDATLRQRGFVGRLHRPVLQSRLVDAIASATVDRRQSASFPSARTSQTANVLADIKGLHFLVAEDNEMNQFVTLETLKRIGCTCEIVGDGELAVDAAQKEGFDAILMDCQMPRMDGLAATRRIRELESLRGGSRHIPIIALTAEAIQGDRERCLAAGMDGYVTKPIKPSDLFAEIRALVPLKRDGPSANEQKPTPTLAPAKPPESALPTPIDPAHLPIDGQALLTRCMNDVAFAKRTLEKFARRASEDVEVLRAGIAGGNVDGAARVARNLNAVARHVSADSLGRLALEIEQAASRRDSQFALEQLDRLAQEARRCAEFIPELIEQFSTKPPMNVQPLTKDPA